jgi:hypothetical protein
VSIDPTEELRFIGSPTDSTGQLKSALSITNVSRDNLAYKVKTTAPRQYIVKPNQGILEPGARITVDISLIPAPENNIEDNKFLVQVAPTSLTQQD